nr:hypothetical protein Q903MT_gene154 [Picea sitchensis]
MINLVLLSRSTGIPNYFKTLWDIILTDESASIQCGCEVSSHSLMYPLW